MKKPKRIPDAGNCPEAAGPICPAPRFQVKRKYGGIVPHSGFLNFSGPPAKKCRLTFRLFQDI